MGGFGLLGRRRMIAWASVFAVLGRTAAVEKAIVKLGLLLMTFGWRSPRLLLSMLVGQSGVLELQCPLNGLFPGEGTRLTVGARVNEVWAKCLIPAIGVKAVNVLPRVACLAQYGISVIVREVANTLDSVRLFLHRLSLFCHLVLNGRAWRMSWGILTGKWELHGQQWWPVCHHLMDGATSWTSFDGASGFNYAVLRA